MQTTKTPYEFLARWDQSGRLIGAHVQHRYVITGDDGTVIGETLGQAEPLTLDAASGFPLGDLLAQAQIDALTAKAAADALRDAAIAAKQAAEQALAGVAEDLASSGARLVAAEERVKELEATLAMRAAPF